MSESVWEAFGTSVDEVPENMFQVQDRGWYPVNVDAEVKQWKEGKPFYFVINFTILEGVYKGLSANRMFPLKPLGPQDDKDFKSKNVRTLSNLKSLLIKLGLNAQQINAFRLTPEFAKAISNIKGEAEIGPQKDSDYNALFDFRRGEASVSASATYSEGVSGEVSGLPTVASAPVPPAQPVGNLENLANLFGTK